MTTDFEKNEQQASEYDKNVKEALRRVFQVVPAEEILFRDHPTLNPTVWTFVGKLTTKEFLQLTQLMENKAEAKEVPAPEPKAAPVTEPVQEVKEEIVSQPKTKKQKEKPSVEIDNHLKEGILAKKGEFTVKDVMDGKIDGKTHPRCRADRILKQLIKEGRVTCKQFGNLRLAAYNVVRSPAAEPETVVKSGNQTVIGTRTFMIDPVQTPAQPQKQPQKPAESKETPKVVSKPVQDQIKLTKPPKITLADLWGDRDVVNGIYKELYTRMRKVKDPIGQHDLKDFLMRSFESRLTKYDLGPNNVYLMTEAHNLLKKMANDMRYYPVGYGCLVKETEDGTFMARPSEMKHYAKAKGWVSD